jgi:ADP-heptose:LPS heptosyltransferase
VLGAALSRCGLYVGNDSGTTHLAAAVGCATVALFGVSDPVLWAPRGRLVRLVRSPGNSMNDLDVDDVWAACLDVLD